MANKFKPGNQGEGDRESAKRYNEAVKRHVESGASPAAAEQAREDVDGEGGEELRNAEREGKRRIAEEDPEITDAVTDDEDDIDRDVH